MPFIVIGIIGSLLFLLGAKWSIDSFMHKDVIQFKINDKKPTFEIKEEGPYAVCIIGGGYVDASNGFHINIEKSTNQRDVPVTENKLKFRFRKDWRLAIEFARFNISEVGKYSIAIQNINHLIVKPSSLWPLRQFQEEVLTNTLEILIKETMSPTKKLLSILFLVLGANIAWIGFVFAFVF